MDLTKSNSDELLCVVMDLWSAISSSENENMFKDYLKSRGFNKEEVEGYIESLNSAILE